MKTMENILDNSHEKTPNTNYKKWAFRLLIYTIIANIAIGIKIASFISAVHDRSDFEMKLLSLEAISWVCFIAGVVFTFLSYHHKEEKNYQYKVSVWGFSILFFLTIIGNYYYSKILGIAG
ncbi:MAG: hypothetical protein DWQ02_12690 [Bacteroidetes bacterium]|nr:MAG: hypothetical protein DWQ02_12690 [Bacteroidota bacterium]